MKRFIYPFILTLIIGLAACSPQTETAQTGTEETESTRVFTSGTAEPKDTPVSTEPASEARTETPPATADAGSGKNELEVPEDAVIVLRREGGIAGVMEQWTIYPNGRIVDADGNEHQVPAEAVSVLMTSLETAGFFDLSPNYSSINPCCDRFTYWLAVRQGDQVHTVTAVEATEEAPASLWEAIAAVQALLEQPANQ